MVYDLHTEIFAEYGIGLTIIGIRFYARWSTGLRNFYWDDLALALAVICWTFLAVFLYLTDYYGSNIGLNAETAMLVPESEVPRLRKGSICAFIAWLAYIMLVWCFKAVMMFLYHRITAGLWQRRIHRMMCAFCISTFMASMLLDLCSCVPTHRAWQIKPYPGDNCTIRPLNYIVIEILNIITDLGILCIPLPLIITAKISRTQKFILAILFSSGAFVIIASILRAYYSVSNISNLSIALGWASREALVSSFVVSAPGIKPLVARWGWFGSSRGSGNYYSNEGLYGKSSRTPRTGTVLSKSGGYYDDMELGRVKKGQRDEVGETGSQERIVVEAGKGDAGSERHKDGGIMVTTEYTCAHDD